MDPTAFLTACRLVMEGAPREGGIGTLGEKSLHAAIKLYLEPRESCREIGVGRYVADILNETGVIEIQTAGFSRLRAKLDFFLTAYPVTVVYPAMGIKWLISASQEGILSKRRRSPRPGGAWDILPELYRLRPMLTRPGLRFCVMVIEAEEYRLKDGKGRRGYSRYERMPVGLMEEIWVSPGPECGKLLPPGLPEEFTAKDFCRCGRFSAMAGSMAIQAAKDLGALERIGTRNRAYVYRAAERQREEGEQGGAPFL